MLRPAQNSAWVSLPLYSGGKAVPKGLTGRDYLSAYLRWLEQVTDSMQLARGTWTL
jgi:hypothetical protein